MYEGGYKAVTDQTIDVKLDEYLYLNTNPIIDTAFDENINLDAQWTSSDSNVITVQPYGFETKTTGTTTLTATWNGIEKSVTVNVGIEHNFAITLPNPSYVDPSSPENLLSLDPTKSDEYFKLDDDLDFYIVKDPEDIPGMETITNTIRFTAHTLNDGSIGDDITQKVTWESEKPTVLSVTPTGTVTQIGYLDKYRDAGVKIRATYQGVTKEITFYPQVTPQRDHDTTQIKNINSDIQNNP